MNNIKFFLELVIALVVELFRGDKTAREVIQFLTVKDGQCQRDLVKTKLVQKIIEPNYRLKGTLKLGKPSLTVYRKFYSYFSNSEIFTSKESILNRQKPKYLIIRDAAMGDVLMVTPMIRELHSSHGGDLSIDVATLSESVFNHNPFVNKVINSRDLSKGVRSYDVVIDLNGAYERRANCHPVDVYGKFAFGNKDFDRQIDIYHCDDDVAYVQKCIDAVGGPYLVVHYFKHEWANREIDISIWDELLAKFAEQSKVKIIFVGFDRDRALTGNKLFLDHRGRYSIQQLKILIENSIGFLGGDSGPSHVAAATSAPMAVFYTCAHHEARMPLRKVGRFMPITPNVECYGCLTRNPIPRPGYLCERGDNACTSSFDVENLKVEISRFFKLES